MDAFVGAEYIIANTLIVLKRKGKDYITFRELRDIGWKVQQYCNENDVSAIILVSGSNISNAIYDFPEYFEYLEPRFDNEEPMVRVRRGISISQIERRFIGYLPLDIVRVLATVLPKYVV